MMECNILHMVKWSSVKILEEVKKEIIPIIERGKFHSLSDFITYASRNEIRNQKLMESKND